MTAPDLSRGVRPSWDDTWLALARLMARRSRCPTGVGAVIVDDQQRVVSTGYAGPPAGMYVPKHVDETVSGCSAYCQRSRRAPDERDPAFADCPANHAEVAAISFADRSRAEGGTMYVSSSCCFSCAKAVANSGVVRVVWYSTEADVRRNAERSKSFLEACGLAVDTRNQE